MHGTRDRTHVVTFAAHAAGGQLADLGQHSRRSTSAPLVLDTVVDLLGGRRSIRSAATAVERIRAFAIYA